MKDNKTPIAITEQTWPEGTTPLVTISCLTYNHENYIRDAIEGFLMQKTTFPVRIVIFEDCSTDETARIIKEYEDKHPSLFSTFYQPVNTWGKEIRQEALKPFRASLYSAKYIALCEGDDYWTDPLKLQKQVDFLEGNDEYSMCFHNSKIIHESSSRRDIDFCALTKTEFNIEDVISTSWFIPTQSIVFRSKYVREMPIWTSYVFGGDMALHLILSTYGKFRYLDEIMSVYRRQKTGLSQINSPFYVENKIIESLCYFNLHTQFEYNNMIQKRVKLLREGLPMSYLKGFWISRKVLLPLYHFFR